ncbi:hypothetical protein [Paraburkholderia sp. UCT2]|uniref:hypothetical protein n=1 Tax=Paraburkholderia sp. UCT2 TaxID=2615208 RepID=UPI001655CDEF|nr:hypothetical protein [Paraburkholderia sp. UCT2]MBC8729983.1 phage tail tape measure protein [Paraburkholderia sp. UCT2]
MATAFKSQVEITAHEGVTQVMESIANRAGNMARVVNERTKFLMNDMAGSIGKKMETIANNTKGLWGQSGVLGALGGALVAGGAVATLNSLAEKAERLHVTAIGLGMSATDMQHWSYAAKQAGLDADMMTRGVAKMNQTLFDVAHGGAKAQAELFKQMGVSVKDAKGNARGITDVAMDVASRFKEHVDRIAQLNASGQSALANTLQAETDNAAQSLFGMKAREIAAMMAQGKEGIKKAFADADATGGILSDAQIQKMERYTGALAKLDLANQGLMAGLFADRIGSMAGKLGGLAEKIGVFQKAHPEIVKFIGSSLVAVTGLVSFATSARLAHMALTWLAGGEFVAKIRQVGLVSATSGRLMSLLSGGIKGVGTAMRLLMTASPWLLAIGAAAAVIYYNWDKIEPVIRRVWDACKNLWNAVEPVLGAFGSDVWDVVTGTLSELWGIVNGVWAAFSDLLPSIGGVNDEVGDTAGKFGIAAAMAESLRGLLDMLKMSAVLATVPFRLLATVLESIADKIHSVMSATKSGGILAGVAKLFDLKENVEILAKRGQQNFAGVGDKLAQIAKDADDKSKVVTAEQLKQKAELASKAQQPGGAPGSEPGEKANLALPTSRPRAPTMSDRPVSVRMDGPVQAQLDAKGRLGIDVRVTADQGLKVSGTGVDRSGAPTIVGDTGVSVVTP